MENDIKAMNDAVDKMWLRLMWGYSATAVIAIASIFLPPPYTAIGMAASVLPMLPWAIQTLRVRRAISKVNAPTARPWVARGGFRGKTQDMTKPFPMWVGSAKTYDDEVG